MEPMTDTASKVRADQPMFVQTAQGAIGKGGTLELTGVVPSTLYNSDRPRRVVGRMATRDFVKLCPDGASSDESDPPHTVRASLESGDDRPQDAVFVIKDPRFSGGELSYSIDVLEGTVPAYTAPVTLFIDPIGRLLSPVSFCGIQPRRGSS
jgi:hypothetical protein